MIYVLLILVAVIGILSTLLATRTGKLKKAKEDLEASASSYKKLASELKTINEIKKEKGPENLTAPTDADERLNRLNRMSQSSQRK